MHGRDKNLESVRERKTAERYLKYLLDLNEPVSCFSEELDIRFESHAKAFHQEKAELVLEVDPRSADGLEDSALTRLDALPHPLRLSFTVGDVLYFASANMLKRTYRTLTMQVSFPIYKLQRRNALRIRVLDEHKAKVNLEGEIFEVHDISASGMSVIIPHHREPEFPKGKVFKMAAMQFAGLDLRVEMEVINVSKIRKSDLSDYKVGLRFHGLSPKMEDSIAKEAYLHTHKIWSRWL